MAVRSKEDELVALSDFELVSRVYNLVAELDDASLSDEFYWHLTEAFERFVPHIERALSELGAAESYPGDPAGRDTEVEHHMSAMKRREGARLLHRLFSGGDDA